MRWLLPLIFVISVHAKAEEAIPASEATATTTKDAVVATATTTTTDASVSAIEAANKVSEKLKTDPRKESEIPLNLDGNKKSSSEGGGLFRILLTLSMLGLVGTGAFIFLRKYSVPKEKKHQTQIKVLQQHYLGPKKSLAIVRVAGESLLIGVTDHNISMLKSLSLLDDEVPEEAPKSFGKVMGGFNKADFVETEEDTTVEKQTARNSQKNSKKELDADEEFAISGIKDIVSKRLKGMRSFQ